MPRSPNHSSIVFADLAFCAFCLLGIVACGDSESTERNAANAGSEAQTTADSEGAGSGTTGSGTVDVTGTSSGTPGTNSTSSGAGGPVAGGSGMGGSASGDVDNSATGSESTAAAGAPATSGGGASSGGGNSAAAGSGANSGDETAEGAGGFSTAGDPCETALFCDDFEDDAEGQAPSSPWQAGPNGATVSVSSTRANSGNQSVQVSTTSGAYKQGFFSIEGKPVFPAAGTEMFGRLMMWLETVPEGSVHWTFIQAEGPGRDGDYTAMYRYGGQHDGRLMANYETSGAATDCWDHSATVMPTGEWACLEWHFASDGDELQFWLNGSELTDMHVTGVGEGCGGHDLNDEWRAPSQFERIRLGWERYQESDARNVWIDDVMIATSRVGCP